MKKLRWLLDCVYPPRCPVCDGIIESGGGLVCRACIPKLAVTEGFHCSCCGKFLPDEDIEYCEDCRKHGHVFDEGYGVFPYHGWPQDAMLRFKFHGRREYGRFFGRWTAAKAEAVVRRWDPQVILPVPMYAAKQRMRGYNQAEVVAEEAGNVLSLPVRKDLLFRVGRTVPQKELDPVMRRQNLRQAFRTAPGVSQYVRVMLMDDIYTTGSTADATAEVLKEAGVRDVYILTVCTGQGF